MRFAWFLNFGRFWPALRAVPSRKKEFAPCMRECLAIRSAIALSKEGELREAVQCLGSVRPSMLRADTLSFIALREAKSGRVREARDIFAQAIGTLPRLELSPATIAAIASSAVLQAACGDFEGFVDDRRMAVPNQ